MRGSPQGLTPSVKAALLVWSCGACFYLLGFFHRVAPAVITGDLMQEFQISAAALGNLSAFYFYSYVAMQIPTGILADSWGPRRLLTCGALLATLGTVMFGAAPTLWWAMAGRLLIGASVAVAFVCLLKLAASWFMPNRFAMLSGLALFFGIVGAICAGTPLRILVDLFGWRQVTLLTALITLLVALGTWIFVRDTPAEKGYRNFLPTSGVAGQTKGKGILADLIKVFRYRNTLLLFIIPGGIVGAVLSFAGLWGVPYLCTIYNVSTTTAATLCSALLVAWALGGPFFGWLTDRLGSRKWLYLCACGVGVAGWAVLVLIPFLSLYLLVPILLIIGFASGSMIISFAFVKESVPLHLAGTVSGVINMGVMMGPMILQPAVGLVLDRLWQGGLEDGIRIYDESAYQGGFSLLLIWISLSFILLIFTKETGCRQLVE